MRYVVLALIVALAALVARLRASWRRSPAMVDAPDPDFQHDPYLVSQPIGGNA